MAVDGSLGGKISNHFSATLPQESRVENENEEITVYDVVKSCFKQITLFRKTEKDWGIAAAQLMNSFEAVTSQKISISPYTLRCYYYEIKSAAGGKKKKKSKSKPSAVKSPAVVESAAVVEMIEVDDIPPEVASASPEKTVAEIPEKAVAEVVEDIDDIQPEAASEIPKDGVAEVMMVDDIPPEVASASPEEAVATPGKRRKKAADAHGGFQVPRRPGFIPPVHITGL